MGWLKMIRLSKGICNKDVEEFVKKIHAGKKQKLQNRIYQNGF